MRRKKAGLTVIEMIIVLMLTTVIIAIMGNIFLIGNKVFSNADVKSDLQIEGQAIHETLSNINMQGSGIKEVTLGEGSIDFEKDEDSDKKKSIMNKWNVAKEIGLYIAEANKEGNTVKKLYTFKIENNELSMIKEGSSSIKILSTNVKSFRINPNNEGIEFEITLSKKKGFSDENYSVNVDVLFRNKDITYET